jgi:flavin-binding protein dodecin
MNAHTLPDRKRFYGASQAWAMQKGGTMSDHVYKLVELVGSSTTSIEDAVQNAIGKANASIRNMRWFEVVETRGYIENGKVAYWQVTVKLGFTVEGP